MKSHQDLINSNAMQPHKKASAMKKKETQAGSPSDESVSGEEDPGAGLELLVEDSDKKNPRPK